MTVSPQERRRRIEETLSRGSVSVSTLAEALGVSAITIRRDLAVLEANGKALRVRGGAMPRERVAYEFSFQEKESLRREAKEAIGRAAAKLVEPEATVFLDTGTTALAVGRALRDVRPAAIVTVNLCVASEYVGQRETRVLVPGGEVGALSPDVYGEWTLERLRSVTVDVAFLGCDSADPADGFYSADTRSQAVTRLMLERSALKYLVADASKFGKRSFCRIAGMDELDGVVTDADLSPSHGRALRRLGLRVVVAR